MKIDESDRYFLNRTTRFTADDFWISHAYKEEIIVIACTMRT